MVDLWPMGHLESMVQDEDATMFRLSGKIFSMYLDDSGSFLYVFGWALDQHPMKSILHGKSIHFFAAPFGRQALFSSNNA